MKLNSHINKEQVQIKSGILNTFEEEISKIIAHNHRFSITCSEYLKLCWRSAGMMEMISTSAYYILDHHTRVI